MSDVTAPQEIHHTGPGTTDVNPAAGRAGSNRQADGPSQQAMQISSQIEGGLMVMMGSQMMASQSLVLQSHSSQQHLLQNPQHQHSQQQPHPQQYPLQDQRAEISEPQGFIRTSSLPPLSTLARPHKRACTNTHASTAAATNEAPTYQHTSTAAAPTASNEASIAHQLLEQESNSRHPSQSQSALHQQSASAEEEAATYDLSHPHNSSQPAHNPPHHLQHPANNNPFARTASLREQAAGRQQQRAETAPYDQQDVFAVQLAASHHR